MASRPGATERSPLRGEARERAILDAALELVAEVGYDRVTCDAIAARARASKATIYRKWPDKAALVADALRRQTPAERAPLPASGSLRQDLLEVVGDLARDLAGGTGPPLVMLLESVRDDDAVRALLAERLRDRAVQLGSALAAQAGARGERVDGGRAATVVEVALNQLLVQTLFAGRTPDVAAQERLVDEVLLAVLGATPAR